jgi:hypothetical protein
MKYKIIKRLKEMMIFLVGAGLGVCIGVGLSYGFLRLMFP